MDQPPEPAAAVAADPARAAVMQFRREQRQRLMAARAALSAAERRELSERIAGHLDTLLSAIDDLVVGVYWPIRGEPTLRRWMEALPARGATCALPVVVARQAPLVFRSWRRGQALVRGIWNIPVPAGGDMVTPDIVIAPMVGFDASGFRLGNGGGFYDRTLAGFDRLPRVIGVGYAQGALATIHPLPHDIPMQAVVTEDGVMQPPQPAAKR